MSAQELENRKGCNRRIIWFFVFAILCVAAFLIVGLVRTCTTEHEEKIEEEVSQQEDIVMIPQQNTFMFFS